MTGMTAPEPAASIRELDQLARRIDDLDAHGTRGTVAAVGVVQVQLAELVKDMGRVEGRLDAHDQRHDLEAAARRADRKWTITTGIAVLALLVTVLALLIPLALHR